MPKPLQSCDAATIFREGTRFSFATIASSFEKGAPSTPPDHPRCRSVVFPQVVPSGRAPARCIHSPSLGWLDNRGGRWPRLCLVASRRHHAAYVLSAFLSGCMRHNGAFKAMELGTTNSHSLGTNSAHSLSLRRLLIMHPVLLTACALSSSHS